jgi:hypothetical protein
VQFIFQPIHHLRRIRAWARERQATAEVDVEELILTVRRGRQAVRLGPLFSNRVPQGLIYSNLFEERGGFIGWLPYRVKRWPLSSDKLSFKEFCSANALPTPDWIVTGSAPAVTLEEGALELPETLPFDYVVKSRRGSFGLQVSGPYSDATPIRSLPQASEEGRYVERFIVGRAVKCWFWNGRPVAADLVEPPRVYGDGLNSIETLLSRRRGTFDQALQVDEALPMLRWQGLTAQSVPAAGQEVPIAFKYTTPYDRPVLEYRNNWSALPAPAQEELRRAGAFVYMALPAESRRSTLFTLDAVLDGTGRLWFLEANSHPMVHPATYGSMLDDLFGFVEAPSLPDEVVSAPKPAGKVADILGR